MKCTRPLRYGIVLLALAMVPSLSADPSSNRPPNVNIVTPANGGLFPEGTDILLGANAPDDGQVLSLEFFANGKKMSWITPYARFVLL